MDKKTITTTNIGIEELKHLRRLSKQHGLKQVEFINLSIQYFRKLGISPSEKIFTPREEFAILKKRVDEVVSFLVVHEKKLSPLMERLILLEKKLSENNPSNYLTDALDGLPELMTSYKDSIERRLSSNYSNLNTKLDSLISVINNR